MKKSIKPYLTFTKNSIERQLSYRANSIIFFLGELMLIAVNFFLWLAIYKSSSESVIKGFSLNEMMVYVILSFITTVFTGDSISRSIYNEVKDGSVATYLIKPIEYEKRYFFEKLGALLYDLVIVFVTGFAVVITMCIKYDIKITLFGTIFYFISALLSYIISFFYFYGFGLLSFKITNMWGLGQIMEAVMQLLSGMLIPLVFFPETIQKIFDFLPFKSMIYTPCMIFLNKLSTGEIIYSLGIQIVWIVILGFGARMLWKTLVKQLTILGG